MVKLFGAGIVRWTPLTIPCEAQRRSDDHDFGSDLRRVVHELQWVRRRLRSRAQHREVAVRIPTDDLHFLPVAVGVLNAHRFPSPDDVVVGDEVLLVVAVGGPLADRTVEVRSDAHHRRRDGVVQSFEALLVVRSGGFPTGRCDAPGGSGGTERRDEPASRLAHAPAFEGIVIKPGETGGRRIGTGTTGDHAGWF